MTIRVDLVHANIDIPASYLAHLHSFLPTPAQLADFIAACQRPLRRSIRVNTLKMSVEQFKARAAEKNWHLTPIPWCDEGFWIDEQQQNQSLGNSAEHLAGAFYIQEASSMLPVTALFHHSTLPQSPCLLDMAAAPGSKTTQIAAKLQGNGVIIANELAASRVKVLHANLVRCGVSNAALTHFNADVFGQWLPEHFDAILLDAPCGGEGTIRKDPHAFKNWSLDAIARIADVQRSLIVSAFHALKPNGYLVYSTCTLSPEENQDICHYLKQQFGSAVSFEPLDTLFADAKTACTPEGFLHVFPHLFDCEGFFVAKIRKNHAIDSPMINKKPRNFPFCKPSQREVNEITTALAQTLNINIAPQLEIWRREQEIWLFPQAIAPFLAEIRFERIGFKLAEQHKKGFRWQHEAIMALVSTHTMHGAHDLPHHIELNAEQAQQWYMGRDIRPDAPCDGPKNEVVLFYRNLPIGIGKWVGNRIKNGLPRELVKDGGLFTS